ncbi:MAG: phosphoribosylanthranilate isomerase, partial [bacterium]
TKISPRFVTVEQVAKITRQLPDHVGTVGIFVDSSLEEIRETLSAANLNYVQLHGEEPPDLAMQLGTGRVWRVVHLNGNDDIQTIWSYPCAAVVADTAVAGKRGGTGVVGNWSLASKLASRKRTVLAGGLNPDNVAKAVQTVAPWGVDVSSGVEAEPGVKDPEKVRQFVRAARAAAR